MRSTLVIARNGMRLLLADAQLLVLVVAVPLTVTPFLRPTLALVLESRGFPEANGSEQAVPGAATLFGFFIAVFVAFAVYRDHGWGVWDRMRSTRASAAAIVVGRGLPYVVAAAGAMLVQFAAGGLLFGLRWGHAVLAVVAVSLAYSSCVVGLGLFLTSITRTLQQVSALGNLAAILFSVAGGALVPYATLPSWARGVAPASPAYWAMRGFTSVLVEGRSAGAVVLPAVVLSLFGVASCVACALLLRPSEPKTGWA